MSWAPLSVSTRDMSGNADSKQISTPIGSGRPDRYVLAERHQPGLDVLAPDARRADQHAHLLLAPAGDRGVLVDQQVGAVLASQGLHLGELVTVVWQGQVHRGAALAPHDQVGPDPAQLAG